MTPELFNLATVTLAYFCWLYKDVAPTTAAARIAVAAYRTGPIVAAIVLLAMASFSKPPNAALIGPIVLLLVVASRMVVGTACVGAAFMRSAAGSLPGESRLTGDLNFQGGERRTYYAGFPFMDPTLGFDSGMDRATNEVLTDIVLDPSCSGRGWVGTSCTSSSAGTRGCCRISSRGCWRWCCSCGRRTRRLGWQWLVFAAVVGETLLQLVWLPYTYYGGPGVLGSRYYMNIYGLQLFLLPASRRLGLGWRRGSSAVSSLRRSC